MLDTHDAEPVRAPGLAALLRRHPKVVRHGAAGAIVAGIALFVVASVAGAAGARPRPEAGVSPTGSIVQVAPVDVYAFPTQGTAAPAAKRVAKVEHAKPAPADEGAISGLAANGIPKVALNAYRVAAARLANVDPGCGIDWALLAGIGREESDHGRFAGAVLHPDGVSMPRIIGIPLNGTGTALITDTDGGRLDGDTVYDRAVGPMQFIPSTWRAYGVDANGDGKADVFNINDAALTSARYLCGAGGNLRTHAGQVAAVLAYNDSDQYLAQVLALADAYRRGIPVSGIPIGNTTGALPPVRSGGYVPPANPGAPTANSGSAKTAAKTSAKTTTSSAPTSATAGSTGSTGSTSGGMSGGTSAKPTPSGGTTATSTPITPATPAPSPTTTRKCVLWDLLDPTHCVMYSS
jgi:membrane-bound lytic murein transglycosylase B